MKLSKRGEYALRALIDLGVPHAVGRPLLSLSELSEKEQIPATFLERHLRRDKVASRFFLSAELTALLPIGPAAAIAQPSRAKRDCLPLTSETDLIPETPASRTAQI